MKRSNNHHKTMIFVAIASILMCLIYGTNMKGKISQKPQVSTPLAENSEVQSYFYYEERTPPLLVDPDISLDTEDLAIVERSFSYIKKQVEVMGPPVQLAPSIQKEDQSKSKPVRTMYQPPVKIAGHPKIAIIIDDMGMDRKRSKILAQMDEKLTLAFLPYAPDLQSLTKIAQDKGHELMIHMPMQAMDSQLNLGTIALREEMNEAEINAQIDKALASFGGYVGLNNHMGSKLTQNSQAMRVVMKRLKAEGLYFIDSVTIGNSVAADVAKDYGLPTARRDVFLDHKDSLEAVQAALYHLEVIANRKGYAIAIGHPRAATIEALQNWLPQAREKGYEFVYASALVEKPKADSISSVKIQPEPVQLQSLPPE